MHRDQGASGRIKDTVWFGDPNQFIPNIGARATNRGDLGILCIGIGNLAIAGDDHALKLNFINEGFIRQIIHALHQF